VADRLLQLKQDFAWLEPFDIRSPFPGGEAGEMFAAFKIGHLYLHVERTFDAQEERALSRHQWQRKKMLIKYSDQPDLHRTLGTADFSKQGDKIVLTPNGDLKLQRWIRLQRHASQVSAGPTVRIQLPGDIHPLDVYELLYLEGLFIESLGLEVAQVNLHGFQVDAVSAAVAELLPIFWGYFEAELTRGPERYPRFHTLLARLRDQATLQRLQAGFTSLMHLLIDEFQDISPELVSWLTATNQLLRQQGQLVSVMGIGDDFQSIYGWRGSHPSFLLNFQNYFPGGTEPPVVLAENYRSRQPIIDAAEAVLTPVHYKSLKHGNSALTIREAELDVDPVCLCEALLSWRTSEDQPALWETFGEFVQAVLRDLKDARYTPLPLKQQAKLSVFVLARTNRGLEKMLSESALANQMRALLHKADLSEVKGVEVRAETFHRAKGLEADFVLLLEDAVPPEPHPLREAVYRQAGLPGTYLQQMQDEARRLAYVALTRARLGVMWVPLIDKTLVDPENDVLMSSNGTVPPVLSEEGCFMLVKRFLRAQGRL
jgi:hypothetical protein